MAQLVLEPLDLLGLAVARVVARHLLLPELLQLLVCFLLVLGSVVFHLLAIILHFHVDGVVDELVEFVLQCLLALLLVCHFTVGLV